MNTDDANKSRSRRRRSHRSNIKAEPIDEKIINESKDISNQQIDPPLPPLPQSVSTTPYVPHSNRSKSTYKKTLKSIEDGTIYKNIVESANAAILTINSDGYIVYNNTATETLFGYDKNELLGCKVNILIPSMHANLHDGYIKNFTQNSINSSNKEQPYHSRYHSVIKKDRTEISVCFKYMWLDPTTKLISAIIRTCEADEEHADNINIQDLEDKNLFVINISHEFRTPLNSIINMVYLQSLDIGELEKLINLSAVKNNLPNKNIADKIFDIKEANDIVCRNCTILSSQINDILDYSKLNSNKVTLRKKMFSLRECVNSCIETLIGLVKEKKLGFVFSVDPEIPDILNGDDERFTQILMNVISNAIKYTDYGHINLVISGEIDKNTNKKSETNEEPNINIICKIIDTGIGIDQQDRDKLFKSFTQLPNSKTRASSGSGLGLAICKKICKLMKGDIWLESSTPGMGSIFVVKVQFEIGKSNKAKKIELDLIHLVNNRALVVDDNDSNLITISQYLFDWNMKPTTTNSMKIALMHVKNGSHFDIAIIDYYIGKYTGIQLARDIRKLGGTFPIILLTSKLGHVDEEGLFFDVIDKPIRKERFLRAVYLALSEQNMPNSPTTTTTTTIPNTSPTPNIVLPMSSILSAPSTKSIPKTPRSSSASAATSTVSNLKTVFQNTSKEYKTTFPFVDNVALNVSTQGIEAGRLHSFAKISNDDINIRTSNPRMFIKRSASFSSYSSDSDNPEIGRKNSPNMHFNNSTSNSPPLDNNRFSRSKHKTKTLDEYHMIIVEDNIDHQKVLYRLLKRMGYNNVDVFSRCIPAFQSMLSKKYDIAFIDINIPEVTGFQLLEMIKDSIEVSIRPILVAVTAVASFEDGEYYISKCGFDEYVSKPINFLSMKQIIETRLKI